MVKPAPHNDLRAPIARARGLGSAKHGAEHWWAMRLTSLALVFLCGWFVVSLWSLVNLFAVISHRPDLAYEVSLHWLGKPWNAAAMILLLAVGFHHAANGVQTVIEDYVHCECVKTASIIGVKFFAVACVVIGVLAVAKINHMVTPTLFAKEIFTQTMSAKEINASKTSVEESTTKKMSAEEITANKIQAKDVSAENGISYGIKP